MNAKLSDFQINPSGKVAGNDNPASANKQIRFCRIYF